MRLIDADALIDNAKNFHCIECERRKGIKNGKLKFVYEIGDAPCRACYVADMIDTIDEAPTVDAVPVRHGRWVGWDIPIGEPDFKCTACNIRVHVPTCMGEPMYEYCPVCGAKMDLEEANDDKG